jgi:hypothetical protein
MTDKLIIDVCCGSKMMWFGDTHPDVLFSDIREEEHTLCDERLLTIKPDVIADFRNLPFKDETFLHVVFDPPHLNKLGNSSWMAKKYGCLLPTWELDIRGGFDEGFRVLKENGILVFKWNEIQIKLNQVLPLSPYKPLYGHTSGKHGRTKWMCFMKNENYKR